MKQAVLFAVALSLACVVWPSLSDAGIYKYVDKNGTVVMVDDVAKVPEEYRDQMEVRGSRRGREKPAPLSTNNDAQELLKNLTANAPPQASQTKNVAPDNESGHVALLQKIYAVLDRPGLGIGLRIIIAVAAVVVIFLVVGKACEMAGAKKAGIIICMVLSGAVIIFLLRTSMQKAADKLTGVKNEIEKIKDKMNAQQDTSRQFVSDFDKEHGSGAAGDDGKTTLTMPLPPKD